MAANDLATAVRTARENATAAFEAADKSPLDHGFAHLDVDGRTSLARALREAEGIDAYDTSNVTIDGVNRYLAAQRAAYRAFVDTLDEAGVDTGHVTLVGRLD